jgi:micrococcal nuclease
MSSKKTTELPFSRTTILTVLALVASLGGYGGYHVYRSYGAYGANFDSRPHTEFRAIDGDTIAVPTDTNTGEIKIRLLGINAPETGECYATEATHALTTKLQSAPFTFERDFEAEDEHNRLLRHILITPENPTEGLRLINAELLREGFVRRDTEHTHTRYDTQYREAEKEAQQNKRGLWSQCPTAPHTTKTQQALSAPHKTGCDIKGNISEKGFGKTYLLPSCPNYRTTTIETQKGEQYFCTELEAKAAGFTKSASCENTFR